MLVHHFLESSSRRLPQKTALVFGERRLSYEHINAEANRLAHALITAGLKRGDRVAIFLDNSVESVVSLFGVLKAGGIFSCLNPTLKTRKLHYILNHLEASFLITCASRLPIVTTAASEVNSLIGVILCDEAPCPAGTAPPYVPWRQFISTSPTHDPRIKCIDYDLATIIYTSGTTADPKGIMMTHLNMVTAASSIIAYLENTEEDIILNVLPLSFDYGLYQVLMCFKFGGTLVLEKSFTFPYVVIDRMVREEVTAFPGVPTIFSMLLRLKNLKDYKLPSLRYFSNTAAAFPVNHIKQLREAFPYVAIYSMYGLSECKRVAYLPPPEIDHRPDSVGIAIPNTEVFIVDRKGAKVGPNKVGELVVRGSHVMRGYWKDPQETARCLKPGSTPGEVLLFTGDLFKMDEEGFLYFVSRKGDLIKTRGERVSPREVENVLYEIDGVIDAAVIPVPDELLGQAIKAVIVKEAGSPLEAKAVLAHCVNNLESFMVPKYIVFIPCLPRTSSGKIDKKALLASD